MQVSSPVQVFLPRDRLALEDRCSLRARGGAAGGWVGVVALVATLEANTGDGTLGPGFR